MLKYSTYLTGTSSPTTISDNHLKRIKRTDDGRARTMHRHTANSHAPVSPHSRSLIWLTYSTLHGRCNCLCITSVAERRM